MPPKTKTAGVERRAIDLDDAWPGGDVWKEAVRGSAWARAAVLARHILDVAETAPARPTTPRERLVSRELAAMWSLYMPDAETSQHLDLMVMVDRCAGGDSIAIAFRANDPKTRAAFEDAVAQWRRSGPREKRTERKQWDAMAAFVSSYTGKTVTAVALERLWNRCIGRGFSSLKR